MLLFELSKKWLTTSAANALIASAIDYARNVGRPKARARIAQRIEQPLTPLRLKHPHLQSPSGKERKKERLQKATLPRPGLPILAGCAPQEKEHNYRREAHPRGSKVVRLALVPTASGSWPADSAIKHDYTSALEHVQRPRDLELVVILRPTARFNEITVRRRRENPTPLTCPLSLSLDRSLSVSRVIYGNDRSYSNDFQCQELHSRDQAGSSRRLD